MLPIIVLYALAALLPSAGFVRLLTRAAGQLRALDEEIAGRGYAHTDWNDFDRHFAADRRTPARAALTELCWDTVLVGSGLACGAVASIWSLYI